MRIALCNEVIAPMPFPQQCEYAAKLGYDGLEIAPYTLSEEPHRMGAAQLAAARSPAEDAGIAVTGLHWLLVKPAGLSISTRDDTVRKKTIDVMRSLIDQCAELAAPYLAHGAVGGARGPRPRARLAAPAARRPGRDAFRGARPGEGQLRRRGRACAKGRRHLLHRSAVERADPAHQHAGRGRAAGERDRQPGATQHARLQRRRPHGKGAAARAHR